MIFNFRRTSLATRDRFIAYPQLFDSLKEFDKYLIEQYGCNLCGFTFEIDYILYPKEYRFLVKHSETGKVVGAIKFED